MGDVTNREPSKDPLSTPPRLACRLAHVRSPSEVLFHRMAEYLGPHTTRTALKTFCAKAVNKAPEALTLADVPQVLTALRPMMRTLIGTRECELILEQISLELGL